MSFPISIRHPKTGAMMHPPFIGGAFFHDRKSYTDPLGPNRHHPLITCLPKDTWATIQRMLGTCEDARCDKPFEWKTTCRYLASLPLESFYRPDTLAFEGIMIPYRSRAICLREVRNIEFNYCLVPKQLFSEIYQLAACLFTTERYYDFVSINHELMHLIVDTDMGAHISTKQMRLCIGTNNPIFFPSAPHRRVIDEYGVTAFRCVNAEKLECLYLEDVPEAVITSWLPSYIIPRFCGLRALSIHSQRIKGSSLATLLLMACTQMPSLEYLSVLAGEPRIHSTLLQFSSITAINNRVEHLRLRCVDLTAATSQAVVQTLQSLIRYFPLLLTIEFDRLPPFMQAQKVRVIIHSEDERAVYISTQRHYPPGPITIGA